MNIINDIGGVSILNVKKVFTAVGLLLVFASLFQYAMLTKEDLDIANKRIVAYQESQSYMEGVLDSLSKEKEILEDEKKELQSVIDELNAEVQSKEESKQSLVDENDGLRLEIESLQDEMASLIQPRPEVEKRREVTEEEIVSVAPPQESFSSNTEEFINMGMFESTAYAVGDSLTPSTVTADGTDVSNTIYSPEGYRIVAVDPNLIPLGSILNITIDGGEPFLAKASDTGSAIKGSMIDLLMGSESEALAYGRKFSVEVKLQK